MSSVVANVVASADLMSTVSVMVVLSIMSWCWSVELLKVDAAVSGLRRRLGGVCGCAVAMVSVLALVLAKAVAGLRRR